MNRSNKQEIHDGLSFVEDPCAQMTSRQQDRMPVSRTTERAANLRPATAMRYHQMPMATGKIRRRWPAASTCSSTTRRSAVAQSSHRAAASRRRLQMRRHGRLGLGEELRLDCWSLGGCCVGG
ncbi:hypothetical protein PVAP13_5NG506186 [Panicum virgatum]|uniref:Uncharacterized protein n=1 Tax=Panicum virgatum TaxID=38727 RepID=A0A8T0S3L5_PANVG|nr:hypothetical protein PVAP13_5NG506186 [Panicum virgatum]